MAKNKKEKKVKLKKVRVNKKGSKMNMSQVISFPLKILQPLIKFLKQEE